MSLSTTSSFCVKDCQDPLLLEYAAKESKLIIETVISEVCTIEKSEEESSETSERGLLNYLCDLHDKLTLRSTMAFLGLYVFLLCFQVIFQLDERLITRPAKPPTVFFNSNTSVILDYYDGNISPARLLRKSEMVVIMYYAPWSLESRNAKEAYEIVAKSLSSNIQVSFYAANCFNTDGTCRKSYKIRSYPVIVSYFGKMSLVFNREITPDNLYSWISYLLKSMVRLTNLEEVKNFVANHDFSVIAYFSVELALKRSPRFRHYFSSSLIAAYHGDVIEKTGFAVLTDPESATYLRFQYDSQIHLYHQNYKEEFPQQFNYTGSAIADWVKDKVSGEHLLHWIVPGQLGKTEQFFSLLSKAPTLILFTKREPLYPEQSEVSIVSQTALEYFSCDNDTSTEHHKRALSREKRRRHRFSEISFDKGACSMKDAKYSKMLNYCRTLKGVRWQCKTCLSKNYFAELRRPKDSCCHCNWIYYKKLSKSVNADCQVPFSNAQAECVLKECCLIMSTAKKSSDVKSTYRTHCNKFKLAKHLGYDSIELHVMDRSLPFDNNSITGLSCGQNITLRFAAVDTQNNNFWMRKWLLPTKGVQVVIADLKAEAIYLMKDEFSRKSLQRMIRLFHNKKLRPHHLTEENFLRKKNKSSVVNLVHKTTAVEFSRDVLNTESDSDVVVLFFGGEWHGASSSIFYVYHTVALYFKQFSNMLQFLTIDVSKNELSWSFKMDRIPSVIFFPAHRKSSSFVFPPSVPFTVPNLVSFVIAHCSTELRWRIALSSCSYLCIFRNKLRTHRQLRSTAGDIIDLQGLKNNYTDALHRKLIESSIQRRRTQLQVLRNLLLLLNSLNKLNTREIQGEALHFSEKCEIMQSSASDYSSYDML